MAKLRVLIVDDSVVVRKILADALSSEPRLEVFTAPNGRIALAKMEQINPDAITLDFEMPEMDGLATLRGIRRVDREIPVIMFSTLTERGASVTLDALAAGANDYVAKPANVGGVGIAMSRIKDELIPKILSLCEKRRGAVAFARGSEERAIRLSSGAGRVSGAIEVVALGVSTGGPNALSVVLPKLSKNFPVPIVIVQHMPAVFTKLLAERLSKQCGIEVFEGRTGIAVRAGRAIIAAGGSHMGVVRRNGVVEIETNMGPAENSCRPAVDVLFRSVASVYGAKSLGVVLTGMGSDGLRGCEHMREAGSEIVVQDEATSVVWGMPGFVAKAGLADRVLPLHEIAGELERRAWMGRGTDRGIGRGSVAC